MSIETKLEELGITLPKAPKPVAAYVPAILSGSVVYTAGQLPFVEGKLKYQGRLGKDLAVEEGADAARICLLNALAAVQGTIGKLDRVENII